MKLGFGLVLLLGEEIVVPAYVKEVSTLLKVVEVILIVLVVYCNC